MATKTKAKKSRSDLEALAIASKLRAKRKDKPKQFTSWSYSRYADYKQCPLKAKLKHIDRIKEPPADAMRRGAAIGKLAEVYIRGVVQLSDEDYENLTGHYGEPRKFVDKLCKAVSTGKLFPDELKHFERTFKEARAEYKKHPQRVVVEDSWALRRNYTKTTWDDWAGCWLRVKIDYGRLTEPTVMVIRDWKTGKHRREQVEEYVEQLELYALSALALNAQLERVEAYLCFLDPGVMYPEPGTPDAGRLIWTRDDLPKLKALWDKRTRKMLLDKSFAARPNSRCTWCYYRKENAAAMPGGKALCKY